MKKICALIILTSCIFSFAGCVDPYQYEPDEMPEITLFLSSSPEVTNTPDVTATPAETLVSTPEANPETTQTAPQTATPIATPDTSKGKTMYVTTYEKIYVLKEAHPEAEVVAEIQKRDTVVTAYKAEGYWMYVQYANGKYGYILAAYLSDTKNGEIMYATGDGINVRKGPSTAAAKVTTLAKGQGVLAFENTNGWIYIRYEKDKYGYVSAQYLSDKEPATAKPTSTPVVTLTPAPTSKPTATATPTATPTTTPEATVAPTATPTATAIITPAPTSVPTETVAPTPIPTAIATTTPDDDLRLPIDKF